MEIVAQAAAAAESMATAKPVARPPLCARCGYDQSGSIATWKDSCPLRGLCTECGLDFPWSNVLGQTARVAWLYESDGRLEDARIGRARRWRLTSWRGLRPRRFWRSIDLATPMHRGRLVRFAVVWLVCVHVVCAVVSGVFAFFDDIFGPGSYMSWSWDGEGVWDAVLNPVTNAPIVLDQAIFLWWMLFLPLLVCALTPIVFLALGETLGRAKVRRRHILRGVCYAVPWCAAVALSLPLALIGVALIQFYGAIPGPAGAALAQTLAMTMLGLIFAAMIWWWRCIARDYLRINHTWAVAVVSVLVGGLAALCVLFVGWRLAP